ncbi:MAG TPA: hypothetical protein VF621_20465 [Pyrinomonadaceae bacterium]
MRNDLTALLVVDSADDSNRGGNDAIRTRLESLGYAVTVVDVAGVRPDDARGMSVVVISTIVAPPPGLDDDLLQLAVPVVVADGSMLEAMGMSCKRPGADGAGPSRHGHTFVRIGKAADTLPAEAHSLSASLKGVVEVTGAPRRLLYGRPGPEALVVATLVRAAAPAAGESDEGKPVIFAYDTGAALCEDLAQGAAAPKVLELRAPARRVGLFVNSSVAESLTADG